MTKLLKEETNLTHYRLQVDIRVHGSDAIKTVMAFAEGESVGETIQDVLNHWRTEEHVAYHEIGLDGEPDVMGIFILGPGYHIVVSGCWECDEEGSVLLGETLDPESVN